MVSHSQTENNFISEQNCGFQYLIIIYRLEIIVSKKNEMFCHSFINFSLCTNKQILYFISFEDFQKNTYLYHFKVTEKTTKMLILRYASL